MDRRVLLTGLVATVATPAVAQSRTVTRLTGEVTRANFVTFCATVADAVDKVIGLKVQIDSPQPNPRGAELGDNGEVYLFDGEEVELNADKGGVWMHGSIVFDGFYLVKYGGMHQSILSFGLQQVDEAAIILNPAVQVVDQAV